MCPLIFAKKGPTHHDLKLLEIFDLEEMRSLGREVRVGPKDRIRGFPKGRLEWRLCQIPVQNQENYFALGSDSPVTSESSSPNTVNVQK
jgi:hypothetical protein